MYPVSLARTHPTLLGEGLPITKAPHAYKFFLQCGLGVDRGRHFTDCSRLLSMLFHLRAAAVLENKIRMVKGPLKVHSLQLLPPLPKKVQEFASLHVGIWR